MSRRVYPWPTSLPTISDGFCGAGGSSSGAQNAGAILQLAMNHNSKSLATHEHNFPLAQHRMEDIAVLNPSAPPHPLMSWWSPECRFHSLSRGKKIKNLDQLELWECGEFDETAERSRMSMDQVWRWAEAKIELGMAYQIIFVENVEEVHYWSGFKRWLKKMLSLGYDYREVHLNSMHMGVGQSRDRVYFVFWRKNNRAPKLDFFPRGYCLRCGKLVDCLQCWKNPLRQWGKYRKQYTYNCEYCLREVVPFYTSAASIINWSKPGQMIGERRRPLKDVTMRRIRLGIEHFSRPDSLVPLLVETCHNQAEGTLSRPVASPCFTQTTSQSIGLALPCVGHFSPIKSEHVGIGEPLLTQTTRQGKALLLPGMQNDVLSQANPFLVSYYSNGKPYAVSDPLCTVSTKARNGLCLPPVKDDGSCVPISHVLDQWSFRMLDRYEIQAAMGFDPTYRIIATSEREAVRQLGLSVTPQVAWWLVKAALDSLA